MNDEPSLEPPAQVGSASFSAKKAKKKEATTAFNSSNRRIWLVGLPFFLALVVILGALWSPVQTRQLKEFEPLTGATPTKISYNLTFEHLKPYKLILKLAASEPVSLTLMQAGQSRLTGQLTPPALETGLVEVRLTNLLDDGKRTLPVTLELSFGAGNWKVGYHNENVYQGGAFEPGSASGAGGDLFFIVDYGSQPLLRLERFFANQQRWNGPAGWALIPLLLALGLVGLALLKLRPDPAGMLDRILYQPRSYLLFAAFCLALTCGLTLTFILVNPPLQGPDEQAHVVRSVALGRGVDPETLAGATEELMAAARLVDNFAWLSYDDKVLNELPANNQAHQAPLYYWVAGTLVKFATFLTDSFAAQSYFARLASLLFWLGTLGAALAVGWVLRFSSPWLALGLPLTVALWPQGLFLASVSNNDNAAACFGAWACFGMLLLFRAEKPRDWLRGGSVLLIALVLADFSKRTVATSWAGFLLGLWLLILLKLGRTWKMLWLGLTALGLVGLLSVFLIFTTDVAARGWYNVPLSSVQHANRTLSGQATNGKYVLKINASQPIEQVVDLFYRPDVRQVFFKGKVKAETNPTRLKIELIGVRQVLAETTLEASETWQTVNFEAVVPAQVTNSRTEPYLQLRFSGVGGAGAVLADELYLYANQPDGQGQNLLVNSSLEEGNLTLIEPYRSDKSCLVCYFAGVALDILSNGRGLVFEQAFLQNLTFFFLTSWGAFGWGQIFLNLFWYAAAALLTGGAILGLIRLGRFKLAGWQQLFGLYCALAVSCTLGIQILVKFWAWLYSGAQDFVAGRFMLIVLLPFLILLLSGLRGLGGKNSRIWLGLWLWGTFLFILGLSALFNHIFLQYY